MNSEPDVDSIIQEFTSNYETMFVDYRTKWSILMIIAMVFWYAYIL